MPLARSLSYTTRAVTAHEPLVWRGPAKEAHRGPPWGLRITRHGAVLVALLLTCAPSWVPLIAGVLDGAHPLESAVDAVADPPWGAHGSTHACAMCGSM